MKTKFLYSFVFLLIVFTGCSKKDNPAVIAKKKGEQKNNWTGGDPIVNGTYKLLCFSTLKCIEVAGYSNAPGAVIQQWGYGGHNYQRWTLVKVDATYYKIVNAGSGLVIEIPFAVPTQGQQFWQNTYSGHNADLWRIDHQGYGFYRITSKQNPTMCITLDGASVADGAKITQETIISPNAGKQLWSFQMVAYEDTQVTNFFKRTSGLIAADAGFSIPLTGAPGGNKSLWLMGDSNLDDYTADGTKGCFLTVRNAGLLQPSNNWTWTSTPTKLGAGNTDLLRSHTTAGYFNWPGAGVQLGDTAYVFCDNLMGNPAVEAGIDKMAKIKVSTIPASGSTLTVASYKSLGNMGVHNFGLGGMVKASDGFVYAYSITLKGFLDCDLFVARFPQSNPNAAWQVYKGGTYTSATSWSTNAALAVAIGNYTNVHINISKVNSKFVFVMSEPSVQCDWGTAIYTSTSSSPVGPFTNLKTIYNIPDRRNGHIPFFYAPIAHPEYVNANNELLITYAINNYEPCVPSCVGGRSPADDYRLKGIRVPLSLIDPAL